VVTECGRGAIAGVGGGIVVGEPGIDVLGDDDPGPEIGDRLSGFLGFIWREAPGVMPEARLTAPVLWVVKENAYTLS
jgi:hypothetical protein